MFIRVSSKFKKSYRKLPAHIKALTQEKEKIFRKNPFDITLDTHKLHGKYRNFWAFTISGQYRIMFAFLKSGDADFLNIGTHEIYK